MKKLVRALEVLAWAGFFAVAALVLALRFWLLPNIEQYREDIVAAVSRTVGQPVKIGRIEAGWLGFNPQVNLYDVRILDLQGREALVLPSVENSIAWRSLFAGELRMHSLAIEGPRLDVRRDAAGELFVAGMKVSAGVPGEPARGGLADWALAQFEIVIRNAEISWHDEKRGAPPLALSALNFRLRSLAGVHSLGLSARPPAELGTTLELRAELSGGSVADAGAWRGRVFAEAGYTDLAAWRPWIDYPFELAQGQGAVRVWTTLERGEPVKATADVELAGVVARLAPQLAPLELARVGGRIEGARRDGGYEVSGRRLALVAVQGPPMEPLDFQVSWTPAGRQAERGSLAAKQLDLQALAQLADVLPLPQELRRRMAESGPRGRVLDANLEWTGSLDSPDKAAGRARFAGLAMNPLGDLPGFAGISGSVEGTQSRVSLTLDARKAELLLPRVFPHAPLAFDTLGGQLVWERKGAKGAGAWSVRVGSLSFANPDLEGKASGTYSSPGFGPGTIDLGAELRRANVPQLERYLPAPELMGPRTRAYLVRSIRAGEGHDARLRLRGDLADFPFEDPAKGEFQVTARVTKGVFEPGEGWPAVHDADVQLLFERDRMEITGRSGTVYGAQLSGVRAAIPALSARETRLEVSGQADGALAEFLKVARAGPAQRMTGGLLDGMRATGKGHLALRMDIPLEGEAAAKVAGDFGFTASSVVLHPELPPIERASGRVAFTESTLTVQEGRGRLFGGPLVVSGGSRPGMGIEIAARGDASVAALQPALDHPWLRHFSGATQYSATATVRDGRVRLSVESALRGITSALPPPLAKNGADALPLRIDVVPGEGGRERITVAIGALAHAELLRRRDGEATVLQRASVWLSPRPGEPVRLPERPGVLLYGSLDTLDADRWQPVVAGREGEPARAAPSLPTLLDLRLGTLDAYGKRLHDVTLRAGIEGASWSANIQASELAGDLSYRPDAGGQLVARLAHLSIPGDAPGTVPAAARQGERLDELPAVDLVAERFTLRNRQLGRVEVLATHEAANWRIQKLSLVNPEGTVSGKGLWRTGAASYTALSLDLQTTDAGEFLSRLGYADLVRGATAKMQASLSWNGDPLTIDYPSLAGEVQLQADDGQFLEVDPGVGKLLSVMSLQALPRRLALDFRDVFSKGFQFDRIRSAAHVDKGVMTLKDFNMRGSAAQVEMSGQVDLVHETQALTVRVVPQLGDTASSALLFVNPFLYFPAALAQRILKDPLGHIFAFSYSVSGSWADPKIERTAVNASPVETEATKP